MNAQTSSSQRRHASLSSRAPRAWMVLLLASAGLLLSAGQVLAAPSPVGYWKMIDDKTNKPSSIVHVFEKNKVVYARVIQLLNLKPGEVPNPVCSNCKGWRKNKPVVGMVFMWGMKRSTTTWSGGKILDPDEGKTYRCKIWPDKGGKELKVRGYVLVFFRTQTWHRVTDKKALAKALRSYAKYTKAKQKPASRR